MLQKLRRYSKSWVSGVFLGILSLAFVSWGVGDILQGHTDTSVVKVGDTPVPQDVFKRDYDNTLKNLSYQSGKTITPEEARAQHIGQDLLKQTILETALDNVSDKLKLTASDAVVTARIRAMQQFAGLNGVFDRRTFDTIISRYGYTEAGFIHMMRKDLTQAQLTQTIASGMGIPAGYAKVLLAYAGELRAVDFVTVSPSLITTVPTPSDAVLEAYVKAHAKTYSTPAYRDVSFARLAAEDISGGLKVTDKQLQNLYDARKSDYVVPEKRTVFRLTFPKKEDAEAAYKKIEAGTSFEDVAKARGFKPADISLGDIQAADLQGDESKDVFSVKEGEVTKPTKSTFGYNIYKVTKIIPGKTTPLSDVKDELTATIMQKLERAKLDDYANAYTDAISNGFTMAESIKKAGMKLQHVAAIDRNGLKPDGTKADAPDDAEFREQIFKAEIGEDGEPLLTKGGVLYIVKVNGVIPPKLKPLSAVKDQALKAWTEEKRAEMLAEKVKSLTAEANKAGSLDTVASATGSKIEKSDALNRRKGFGPIGNDLLGTIFDAKPGAVVSGKANDGKSYVIAKITAVAHPLPEEKSPQFMQAEQAISRAIGQDVVTSFAYAARDKQGVKINQKQFNSTIGLGEGS